MDEEYFISSLTAEEIERILTHSLTYDQYQRLSPDEQQQVRINLGIDSTGLTIMGKYSTFEALQQAIPFAQTGNAYAVGTETPYEIYIWLKDAWVNFGNIYGAKGENGRDGKDGTGATLIKNTTVLPLAWAFDEDDSYSDYPYRAAIPIDGITSDMIAEVIFSLKDAASGMFAPINETFDGGLYIHAVEELLDTIVIPTIIFWMDT